MLWLLAYLIVGMAYVSFGMQPAVRQAMKEYEGEPIGETITIVMVLLFICIFSPMWPAFVTMKIAGKFHKKTEKE
ncbi:hypothetical protein FC697_09605 [Bacillus wiedmannii]|uniref:hypothetical protein n=1 Tax=Bacillus wiedmannii TaxID=1890302 RepID=UPI0010BD5BA7|nr:hypothetical protein [Bacillus wiedmannii]TKH23990.1 hypothetical protein FC697_09605 [Bacillus wiedmannii]